MAKGIAAFMAMVAIILAISMLSGLGYYGGMSLDYSDSANDDVQSAADAFIGQNASDRGSSVLEDFTASAGQTISSAWQVLANTSGVLQLLLMFPPALADPIQLLFQMTFGITFAAFLRGVVW